MKLKEIIHLEEALLMCKTKHQFTMPFDDYVIMHEFIDKIENVTNLYFTLIMEYEKYLKDDNKTIEERKKILQEYNQNILENDVNFDFTMYKSWMIKYVEKEKKENNIF